MRQTECFGIPVPECDPPLTKDASDIEQFRDLAFGVDAAVGQLAAAVTEFLTMPDSASMNGGLTAAGRVQNIPYTAVDFDNTGMASPTSSGLKIVRAGWYIVGGYVRAIHNVAAGIGMRVQPLLNGDPTSNRQGPGRPVLGGASSNDEVAWQTVMQLAEGDVIRVRTNHVDSVALSVAYNSRLWATRILTNV